MSDYDPRPTPTPTPASDWVVSDPAVSDAGYSDPTLQGTPSPPRTVQAPSSGPDENDAASAKDRAAESAQAGKQAAGDVANTAKDKAQDVVGETKNQASELLGQAQDQLQQQLSTQHRSLVDNLHALGDELSGMADNSERSGPATNLVAEAGSRAHTVASWIGDRQPGELLGEVRSYARRNPGTFVLGALAAGIVAGRLTRGVVAVHKDDSPDGAPSATPSPRHATEGSSTSGDV